MAKPRTITPPKNCKFCGELLHERSMRKQNGRFNGVWYPESFCSKACANRARPAKLKIDRHGYVYHYRPGGTKTRRTQVYEHRLVMEGILGRELTKNETVHHKNGNRNDNRPENLELWMTRHGKGQRASDLHAMSAASFVAGAMSLGG